MRKQCKRKVRALVNPISMAIEGACITTEGAMDKLRLLELGAIDAFAKGMGSLQDVHTLCAMVNVCEQMARDGIGPEALEACGRADAGLIAMARRAEKTAKLGIDALTLIAFRDVFAYHDAQRQAIPRSEYEKQIRKATNRVKSGAPGVVAL